MAMDWFDELKKNRRGDAWCIGLADINQLVAEVERLRAEVVMLRTGDMFWPVGAEGDRASSSPEQWANDEGMMIGSIVEFDVAHRLPNRYFQGMRDPYDPDPETAWLELREMSKEGFEAKGGQSP